MKWNDEDLPPLRELESAVMGVWRASPDMTDHVAARAYEAPFQYHRVLQRGHGPKDPAFSGLNLQAYQAVRAVCERILTSGSAPLKNVTRGNTAPLSNERLMDYLRELHRSVERHTAIGGRRGYLEFLRDYGV
jgi:hypothetical protein